MLLWPLLVTLLLGFIVLGWFVVRSVRADAISRIDAELVRVSEREFPPPGRPPPPRGRPGVELEPEELAAGAIDRPVLFAVRESSVIPIAGPTDDAISDSVLLTLAESPGFVEIDGADGGSGWRVYSTTAGPGVNIAAIGLEDVSETVSRLQRSLIIGGIGVFALQAIAVWVVTRRIAEPIQAVAGAASSIADGALETPIPVRARPHETAELASAVGVMVQRLRTTIDRAEVSADEAEAARAQMQRFLADASHELRTPLTSIRGYAQLYNRDALDDEELDRAMHRVESESGRLARLVDDMLVLARGVDQSFAPSRTEIARLVRSVGEDLRAAHPDRTIVYDLGAEGPVEHDVDGDQLHQAVLNLGMNALQHSPPTAPVTLRVTTAGERTTIEVVDHGEGIAPEDAERIFEAFYRSDSSRHRADDGSGAGLGLAITKMIADRHGAELSHAPTPGGGTTFSLALPSDLRQSNSNSRR